MFRKHLVVEPLQETGAELGQRAVGQKLDMQLGDVPRMGQSAATKWNDLVVDLFARNNGLNVDSVGAQRQARLKNRLRTMTHAAPPEA